MSGRLVCSRVQAEVEHKGSAVVRGDEVGAAESVWSVAREEGSLEVVVDWNTVSLEQDCVDGWVFSGIDDAFGAGL